jgi:hypothetical protein
VVSRVAESWGLGTAEGAVRTPESQRGVVADRVRRGFQVPTPRCTDTPSPANLAFLQPSSDDMTRCDKTP